MSHSLRFAPTPGEPIFPAGQRVLFMALASLGSDYRDALIASHQIRSPFVATARLVEACRPGSPLLFDPLSSTVEPRKGSANDRITVVTGKDSAAQETTIALVVRDPKEFADPRLAFRWPAFLVAQDHCAFGTRMDAATSDFANRIASGRDQDTTISERLTPLLTEARRIDGIVHEHLASLLRELRRDHRTHGFF